ncbi:MAG: IPExxxVDY family protein [Flavobacteriales bacterium]|nr:IPExxxVDY family protein [Flavobacteriales bacterium]
MAKHKLIIEEEYEFELIGICSNYSDYRLCWGINKALNIQLSKGNDYEVTLKKEGENKYSFYEYYDEDEHIEYYLIKNLSNTYKRLIPEKDQIDYFIIIKNNYVRDVNDMVTRLKGIESILTAFIFDVEELKSKSNLEF